MVLHLITIGTADADDSSYVDSVYKRHVVQNVGLWRERNHPHLVVPKPLINPYKRSFPVEFTCKRKRNAVLRLISYIFVRIELETHIYCSYDKFACQSIASMHLRHPAGESKRPKAAICEGPYWPMAIRSTGS